MKEQLWPGVRMILVGLVAWAVLAGPAEADFIVSPNNDATKEGNLNSGFPFNLSFFRLTAMRYQQVYSNSDFSSLGGPAFLTQIAFRPDAANGNAFSPVTLSNVQISLSTTSKGPDGLSTMFAQNLGPDNTLVFNGPLTISSKFTGPAQGPKDFDILINLRIPFLYDPSKGNLLMEVRSSGESGLTSQLNAENVLGDSVSRLYNTDNNLNGTTGFLDTFGLVTRFDFPVPEPSTIVLVGLGTLGLLGYGSRRRSFSAWKS